MKYSKATLLLSFTQMGESFSFFGMRALLVLFLIQELGYNNNKAFALYALYIALVEMGSFVGGFIADRYLGMRGAILWGCSFITAGHLCLSFGSSFFMGLGLIITGSTLFRSNLKALLGQINRDDSLRNSSFTLLYSAINLGGFTAALLCSLLAQMYEWKIGFGIATIGMIVAIVVFTSNLHLLKDSEAKREIKILLPLLGGLISAFLFGILLTYATVSSFFILPITALIILKTPRKLSFALLLLIFYFAAEELMGSLLVVFSEKKMNRYVFGFEIPASALSAINPLLIIATGPLLAKIEISLKKRIQTAFLSLFFAFTLLYIATRISDPSVAILFASYSLIAIGELFFAPAIFSFCSKIAPEGKSGVTMGFVTLAFSLASLLSGQISTLPFEPGSIFITIAIIALGLFAFFFKSSYWNSLLPFRNSI